MPATKPESACYTIGLQGQYRGGSPKSGRAAPLRARAIAKGTVFAIAGALLSVLGFWIQARLEEGFFREQLGAEAYDGYGRRVPMLVPFRPT